MDFQRLQLYKKEAVIFFILLGIGLSVYFFFWRISGQAVLAKEAQWIDKRVEREKFLRQKKVERDLGQFISLLQDQQHYAGVINTPNEIARRYHLQVPSVTYQKERVEEDFMRVSFAFSVTGSYESIRRFISEIESEKSLYIIEDMSLGKSSKEGSLLELQLKMAAYLRFT